MNGRTATATCKQYSLFVCSVAWRQQWFTALVVTRHCLECLSTRLGWGGALHLAVESTLRLHAMPMQMRAAVCWCCNSHAPVICSWHHASEVQSSLTHSLQILHSQSSAPSSTFKSLLKPGDTSALDATQQHRGPVTAHATTNVESKVASTHTYPGKHTSCKRNGGLQQQQGLYVAMKKGQNITQTACVDKMATCVQHMLMHQGWANAAS